MTEEWRVVVDFPRYSVSNLGNIRGVKGRNLKLAKDKYGYICVCLYKEGSNGRKYRVRVHRIVAKAFIPNPSQKPYVNHIDGARSNNRIDNLEWATNSDNQKHRFHILKHGITEEHRKKMVEASIKVCSKKVLCVETGEIFMSVHEAAKAKKIWQSSISYACNGRYKVAGGFHWSFI